MITPSTGIEHNTTATSLHGNRSPSGAYHCRDHTTKAQSSPPAGNPGHDTLECIPPQERTTDETSGGTHKFHGVYQEPARIYREPHGIVYQHK